MDIIKTNFTENLFQVVENQIFNQKFFFETKTSNTKFFIFIFLGAVKTVLFMFLETFSNFIAFDIKNNIQNKNSVVKSLDFKFIFAKNRFFNCLTFLLSPKLKANEKVSHKI